MLALRIRSCVTAAALLGVATLAAAGPAAAPATRPASPEADESRPDEAALRAIVRHWDRAEAEGDVAYLSQLLAPEYRSVGGKGEVTARAALLEQAQRVQRSPEARAARRKSSEAFLRAHPTEVAVTIHGAVGVVSYYNPTRGVEHSVRGADVFVYEDGHWHAIHAMHNSAE